MRRKLRALHALGTIPHEWHITDMHLSCPPTLLPASLVIVLFVAACQAQLALSVARLHIATATNGSSFTYFAGGQLYVSCFPRDLLPTPRTDLTDPSAGSGIATDVVDYIDWSAQPLVVRQLPRMRNLRREAAAVFTAGSLVVGGGLYASTHRSPHAHSITAPTVTSHIL